MKGTRPLDNDEIRLVSACFTGTFAVRNRGLFMIGVSISSSAVTAFRIALALRSVNLCIVLTPIVGLDAELGAPAGVLKVR